MERVSAGQDGSADRMRASLAKVWQRSKEAINRRAKTIEDHIAACARGAFDEGLRAKAEAEAHKLTGSLGVFALPEASEIARQIEEILSDRQASRDADLLSVRLAALRTAMELPP